MSEFKDYRKKLESDAEGFANEYFDDFLEQAKEGSTDFHDYMTHDGKIDEHADEYLDLGEAVDIIENCENEETDSGLWEGLPPKEAIVAMAIFSYRNDLQSEVSAVMQDRLENEVSELEDEVDGIHEEIDDLNEQLENIDSENEDYEDRKSDIEDELKDLNENLERLQDIIENIQTVIDDM